MVRLGNCAKAGASLVFFEGFKTGFFSGFEPVFGICFLTLPGFIYILFHTKRWVLLTNKKSGGKRKRTRSKLRRHGSKLTIRKLLRSFEPGAKVHVKIDSAIHSGLPHHRFKGLTGLVLANQGKKGVLVRLLHGNKPKIINVHAAHLEPVKLEMKAAA